jgi:hypothetical protein
VARRVGIVTGCDDEFLARTEPFAEPRGGGPEHGASGYAAGLRRTRRASRHNKSRDAMHKAYVVSAGVMGIAVVAAAAVAVLVFAGVFAVSPGTSGGHRRGEAVEQQPSSTTTPPSSPSTTRGAPSPSTAAETGRSPLRPSHPVAIPDTTTGEQVPARPASNSGGSEQMSSASSPTPSGASAPGAPTAPALSGDDRTDRRHHGLQLPKAQPHITTAVSNEPRHT